jgi:predicted phosphate transport protein (TIGR00153 family)
MFPRNTRFYDLFEEMGRRLVSTSEQVADLLTHFENVEMKTGRIKDLEHEADTLTHDLYTLINQTFVTPFDREDIVALAQSMDDVVDELEAATTAMRVYGITRPTTAARGLADLARLQCMELNKALGCLRQKGQLKTMLIQAREVNRLENEADALYLSAMAELFQGEMDSVDIIKWRDVYEYLEASTDACENVAHVLEGIVLKHA